MAEKPIYKDPQQAIEERVKDLLLRMTIAEKVGQMTQIERSVVTLDAMKNQFIGSILNAGGSTPRSGASAEEWADMVDGFQRWALESRLSIPVLYGTDAVHGHNNCYGATIFPHNIGLGATRDPNLVQKIGEATAIEVRATGIPYTFAPCVAVSRDPRWGRCYESYSEDTETVRKMTTIVQGLQGSPPQSHPKGYPFLASRKNVIACMKHFIGDGGTKGGINEGNTVGSFDELHSVHLKPFLDCLDQGVCTAMASYSSWNSMMLHSHHFLLTQVLKHQLGFKGFVISDWEGIDRLCQPQGSDYRFCISASINAGIDMVMVPHDFQKFIGDLTFLVESGEISMTRIDDAVERILRVKFVGGLFEHPFTDRSLLNLVGCKMHRELAREAVRKSLVLLKNGKNPNKPFLPLSKNGGRILVGGEHAHNLGYQCGGWTITWYGIGGQITQGTTILEAIKAAVGMNTAVIYEENPTETSFKTQEFSSAIVVVGEKPYAEFLGDDPKLELSPKAIETIELVCSKVPTLVILLSGRPLIVEPLIEKMEAFVAAWLPGSEGAGVADVIFGGYEFHGCLPRTWFKRVDQLPMNVGDSNYDPLFPFGFGLKMNLKNQ
ncbi:uncharacterized protein LOC18437851 isoform X1 [Amborella trichopoda]|uniref:Uncharacterized protein n=2 Tax=Amborella trichopoda TaxID=13333 RepID=W1PPJ1_AMBTC|nr:uncharacterized protein LOC18437851 isoform X1 [Amborella trichopoda]ERN09694.1 hypothetical protein AMTR_s00029p00216320 [Amborella trichopoda]|eukprot:XP_006848113.1 uncharacterized protein LOC18437851 isoform X1 [Amborella trichopoda]